MEKTLCGIPTIRMLMGWNQRELFPILMRIPSRGSQAKILWDNAVKLYGQRLIS